MADSPGSTPSSNQPQNAPNPPSRQPNSIWRMMGFPSFRLKLPSRNWMIFLTITGSFAGAVIYDRTEKRRIQQKWCDHVAHLSTQPLPVEQTPRRVTVFLSAPPGDSLQVARSHFREYVKPILVAAALDYIIIEGIGQGDIRYKLAERIRKSRRKAGEPSIVEEEQVVEDVIADAREKLGVYEEPGPKGDLVIGRNTWKEYVRGLHEGWLGPLDPQKHHPDPAEGTKTNSDDEPPTESAKDKDTPEDKTKKSTKRKPPTPAYTTPADYSLQGLPPSIPQSFDNSAPIPFPHILGFLNTPVRIYRFLNRRYLADNIGREVAGLVLASAARPYGGSSRDSSPELSETGPEKMESPDLRSMSLQNCEQQSVLEQEEEEWPKSIRKRDESDESKEREWLDEIVLDPRIASRMRLSVLSLEEEMRAQRIGEGKEYILGEERSPHVPFWKDIWIKYGYGGGEEKLVKRPIIDDLGEGDRP